MRSLGLERNEPSLKEPVAGQTAAQDLSYLQGWLCAVIPLLGLIIALVNVSLGYRRRAFQAIALHLAVIIWMFLIMSLSGPMSFPYNEERASFYRWLMWLGVIGLPFAILWLLRKLNWPERIPVNRVALSRRLLATLSAFFLALFISFSFFWVMVDVARSKADYSIEWSEKSSWGWIHLIDDERPNRISLRKTYLSFGGRSCVGINSSRHYDWDILGFTFTTISPCTWIVTIPYWFLLTATPIAALACFLLLRRNPSVAGPDEPLTARAE